MAININLHDRTSPNYKDHLRALITRILNENYFEIGLKKRKNKDLAIYYEPLLIRILSKGV